MWRTRTCSSVVDTSSRLIVSDIFVRSRRARITSLYSATLIPALSRRFCSSVLSPSSYNASVRTGGGSGVGASSAVSEPSAAAAAVGSLSAPSSAVGVAVGTGVGVKSSAVAVASMAASAVPVACGTVSAPWPRATSSRSISATSSSLTATPTSGALMRRTAPSIISLRTCVPSVRGLASVALIEAIWEANRLELPNCWEKSCSRPR